MHLDPDTLKAVRPPHRSVELPGIGMVRARAMTLSDVRMHRNGWTDSWTRCVQGLDGREFAEIEGMTEEAASAALQAVIDSPPPTLADRKLWRGASTELRLEMDARLFAEETGYAERCAWLLELLTRSCCRVSGLALPWKQGVLDRLAGGGK